MPLRVFVSYASTDRPFVQRLAADLGRADVVAWVDQRMLDVGADLAGIEAAIVESDCLVIVVSAASMTSGWVGREIAIAERAGVRVLPALLETVAGSERLAGTAFADFRRPAAYRRELFRLIAAIEGVRDRSWFLTAKEAVAKVRSERGPAGQLFGVSQQGVAILYALANRRDWESADTTDGTSRMWITEFFQPDKGLIEPFAVVDGIIHPLPEMYLYDVDPVPLKDSVVDLSCALNHLPGWSEDEAQRFVREHAAEMKTISRRYSRFRPVVLTDAFVDSPAAVAAALEAVALSATDDRMVLTKLERDKRNRRLPTWSVSIFDPALSESTVTVGVDAGTGEVRNRRMRPEMLNAAFFVHQVDADGSITISIANQLRALDNHVWDIPERTTPPTGMTAEDAITMTQKHLDDPTRWQLAFLSNTGVTQTVAPSGPDGLMSPDGRAGQWVVELCGLTSTPIRDGDRTGFEYPFKRLICVPEGLREENSTTHLILSVPLSETPLPAGALDALERARKLAISSADVEFQKMSVALGRTPPEAEWYFRFYDNREIVARVSISGDGYRETEL